MTWWSNLIEFDSLTAIKIVIEISRYIPVRFIFDAMAGLLASRVYVSHSPSRHIAPVAFEGHSPLTVAGAATVSVPNGHTSPCSLFIRRSYWFGRTIG